jgi:hypothetical protein
MYHYNAIIPQLDMLALHHGLPLYDERGQADDLGSLKSEAAQTRRVKFLDQDMRDMLRENVEYIATQTQAHVFIRKNSWKVGIEKFTTTGILRAKKVNRDA